MQVKSTSTIASPIRKQRFFYGWVITFIAGLGVFFSGPGQTYSVSMFTEAYEKTFHWNSSLVSGIYSSATLVSGLILFLVGRLVDKFGHRVMSVVVGSLLALACFWNSIIINPVMLFIGYFMIRFFGQGSMTLVANTLVPQWFIENRGKALSLMAIGGFLSSALLPPVNAWLITTFNWHVAWRVWGILLLVLYVPLAYLFIKSKPEDHGLLPDGKSHLDEKSKKSKFQVLTEVNWTPKEAMKTKAFWLVLFCVSIPAMVNTGITFHLVSILGDAKTAALVLSLMAIIGFPVTFVSGYLADRFKTNIILGFMFLGHIVAILILLHVNSISMAIFYGVIWGLISGFERIILNIIWPNYFGREHLGSIKGMAMTATVIGSAFGPLPFGIAYDVFGGYHEILYIMMLFPLLGSLSAFLSPKPEKRNVLEN